MNDDQRSQTLTLRLRVAGCVAAEEEALEIMNVTSDPRVQDAMVDRRVTGEPLAWIVGSTEFCGIHVVIDGGVYVPRWQTEPLVEFAAERLPDDGIAVDLCTGSGAIAIVLKERRPHATVMATETDPIAIACARRNGVTVYEGDLDSPLPMSVTGKVDVMVGSLPYVPSEAFHLLPRDVQMYEPRTALDGGVRGLEMIGRAVTQSVTWLAPNGWLILEIGGEQAVLMQALLGSSGFCGVGVLNDEDGDVRGVFGRLNASLNRLG